MDADWDFLLYNGDVAKNVIEDLYEFEFILFDRFRGHVQLKRGSATHHSS